MRRRFVIPTVVAALTLGPFRVGDSSNGAAAAPQPLHVPSSIGAPEPPPDWPGPPATSSPSYLLIDAETGQTLAAKDADLRRPVASTVKVLTALSVLRRASLDELVTVGDEVGGLPPDAARVGVEPGEAWTVGDLLEGLIARSGNDAALALAVHVAGTVERFVWLMGADAAALGLDSLTLHEPAGLGDGNRLSARDLAVITRSAMADPRFVALAGQPVVDLPGVGPVTSRNRLLRGYPGALGVKTGFTRAAGRCLVATAERDGRRLLAVVLGSPLPDGHFTDARALLDFGFANFARVPVAGEGPELELRVPGGWVRLDAPPTSLFAPATAPLLDRTVRLPVEAGGDLRTTVQVRWHGVEVATLPLNGGWSTLGIAPDGATAVGDWVMGRAYAAMRAATVADSWAVAGSEEDDRGGAEPALSTGDAPAPARVVR